MHQHRHAHNVPSARELRSRETNAESLLWEKLRGRRLNGLKFRRQHPVGPFVLDFCCAEYRLAIELDGDVHEQQEVRDAEREALLKTAGYRVLRFANDEVVFTMGAVIAAIGRAADSEPLPRPVAPGRDAGWR